MSESPANADNEALMSKGSEKFKSVRAVASLAGEADSSVSGRWVNPTGTVIDLREHSDGRVNGTLRLGVDGPAYRLYQLRGTQITGATGDRGIVGTVSGWPHPASLTVWCAEIEPGAGLMSTKLLSAEGTPLPLDWDAVTGGSRFTRDEPRQQRRHGRKTA